MKSEGREKAVVIGGGIVGVSTAWHLLRRGADVTLIDRDEPGRGCSFGNAGAVSFGSVTPLAMPGVLRDGLRMLFDPAAPLRIPLHYLPKAAPWLRRFVRASRPEEVKRLAGALSSVLGHAMERHVDLMGQVGAPELIQRRGQLHLYPDEASLGKDKMSWALRAEHGLRIERLKRGDILALEPEIGADYSVGIFTPDQGMSINPYRQVAAIVADFARRGGRIVRDRVAAIEVADQRVRAVRGEIASYDCDHAVVCAGAWSAQLLAPLGYDIPLESQRGYHVMIASPGVQISRPVIAADRKVFLSPMEEGLRVAGTVEFGGLERKPSRRRAEFLMQDVARVFPRAQLPNDWSFWMGHRPCLPDSLPVLGPSRHQGLWFNFGHGHLGLTMSATTSEMLARAVCGEPSNVDLAPFSADRF
ncbi:FAD-dependent oxidoreductase [Bradyrhizobium sp. LHD-71]|uniref:NAD(P)/FAD-dependent oxidoreductase n=1 Tax=Bradyrhizobium sp. LHD-71 TaxID=3072141 RepID=UPI00280E6DA0|nr:FAD-dependent oxidoreductase [Bradyrhizobium sp. LHD-71]MDQ8727693.1 FAD-dependent oxidoreductase [Bradyrhizobium sp. LHD-71]